MPLIARHLALHGAIVLCFGLLLGAPYGKAINRGAPAARVNAWRVAHLSLPIGGTLMLAVAALLPWLQLGSAATTFISVMLIVSGYAFSVAMPLAAISGQRGLSSSDRGAGRVVYLANLLGAATSVGAAAGLAAACAYSLA